MRAGQSLWPQQCIVSAVSVAVAASAAGILLFLCQVLAHETDTGRMTPTGITSKPPPAAHSL